MAEVRKKDIQVVSITLCKKCHNWHGYVKEKYNGIVPVHCACTLKDSDKNGTRSPSMICPDGKTLWWTPISEHLCDDGRWWHTAHFSGPPLN